MKLIATLTVTFFVLLGLGGCIAGMTALVDDLSKPVEWYYMLGDIIAGGFLGYIASILVYSYYTYIKNKLNKK